jgi:O-antigen/teichoic acid export membrane protein
MATTELEIQSIKRRSIIGAFSYFSRTLVLQGIGFAASAVLSALLTAEDYGLYGAVTAIIGVLIFFSDVGLAAALVQKKEAATEDDYVTAFTIQQGLAWFIFLVTVVIAYTGILSDKVGPASNWIMLSLGLSFPLASLKTIPSIMLERKLDFSKLVIPQIVEQLLFNGTLIVAVLMGMGVMAYVPAVLVRSISGVITMYFIQPWRVRFGWSQTAFKSLIGFGAQFQLNDFLARIKDQLFYLFLAFYFVPKEFGYINWSKTWSMYPYNLTVQNVMSITFPAFSRLQNDKRYLQRAIEKSLFFISIAIFPVLVGMCLFISPLLTVFPVYSHWRPAVISLVFFTLSIAGGAISTPLTNTLNALGKISVTLRLMIMWTVLTWVLTPLAIYFYGFNGVAIAAFVISLTSFIPIIYVKKIVNLNVVDQLWRQTIAVIAMAITGFYGQAYWSDSLPKLLVGIMICAVVYCSVLMAVGHKKVLAELKSLRS